jgi:hypothetical protein
MGGFAWHVNVPRYSLRSHLKKGKTMTHASKRKQDKIEPAEVRNYKLRVMLNHEELEFLDTARGRYSRAEATRYFITQTMPSQIPSLNSVAWTELSKSAANLNQIAHNLNNNESLKIEEIRTELEAFRRALIGAQL